VGDDHDLLCRTYLSGASFGYTNSCLYLYRYHHKNTFLQRNPEIVEQVEKNQDRYQHELAIEWCDRNKFPKVDLGGAHNAVEGFTTVDLANADICCDIVKEGLPFEDDSVGCIRASDFLEHIPQGHGIINAMNEIYRVLVPGGWLLSATPSTDGRGAFQSPDHVSFWNENSFWYYTNHDYAKYVPKIKCRFQSVRCKTVFPSDWHKHNQICYVLADLCALKGQRQPGLCLI